MKRFTILFGLAVLFLTPVVLADIPKLINFQGILRDGSGNPVVNGVYTVRFRVYDDSTAGSTLWEETVPVPTTSGLFSVRLGDATALPHNLFSTGANRFVGIRVNLDPEMAPRTRVISVPYTFHALRSDSAATATIALDLTCTGCVGNSDLANGAVSEAKLADGSVTNAKILDGTIGSADIDQTQVQRRVTGTALPGEYITAINQDGSVTTAADQTGAASGWNDDGTVVRLTDGTDKVGIGTTSPLSSLHISRSSGEGMPGNVIDGGLVINNNGSSGDGVGINLIGGSNGFGALSFGDNGHSSFGEIYYHNGQDFMQFTTNNVNRMWIVSTGNVGIGTPTPVNLLDVEGSLAIGSGFAGSITAPTDGLLVQGNVGIGTTGPSTPLQVTGQISASGGTASAPAYTFAGDLNTGIYGGSDFLNFATGGTRRGYVTSNGQFVMESRAQIGTTTSFGDPSTLYVQGSVATDIRTVTGSTTLTSSNSVVLVNTGTATLALPGAAFAPGRQYTIKKISASAGIITVDGDGAETIDGAATYSLTTQYQYVVIVSNGSNWFVVANN